MTDFDVRRVCEFELEQLKDDLLLDPNNLELQERITEVRELLEEMDHAEKTT